MDGRRGRRSAECDGPFELGRGRGSDQRKQAECKKKTFKHIDLSPTKEYY
ncbi:hypothetical protein NITGR_620043 [Nitrospina gracilis 3/211]|uniref:Uncharacterized protein n=1 Tax=Nitrospina gracilis (strain 3/211) TaxID=1266370 RepID=M1Z0U4_NITG3|nr:hypothetical protein NITGR_620043 [Nitrospina gracilis 3/211]